MVEKAEISIMSNCVRVLFFAGLKVKAGMGGITIDLENTTSVYDLRRLIAEAIPEIAAEVMKSVVAVNKEYAGDDERVPANAEIAIFPPVSGGEELNKKPTCCWIQNEDMDIDELIKKIITPTAGAIGLFVGVVRSFTQGSGLSQTEYMTYEAYLPMAEKKLHQIASEIRERWPSIEGIAIIQRCGDIEAGQLSVLVACSAPHRDNGVFEAARYGIDRLKEIVPVWKRETGPDGQVWLEGSYIPKPGE
jgi:molybdopterin converting factor subunit 1